MGDYTVYKHTSPSGKVYIGITHVEPRERWKNGLGYRTQKRFYRAIVKYGWDAFTHEVLFSGLSEVDAKNKEVELIALYNSTDKNHGYNVTLGGEAMNGYIPPQEVREKISRANKGRKKPDTMRKRLSIAKTGTHASEEAKRNMSQNHADISGERNPMYGRNHSEETRRKISQTRKRLFAEGALTQPKKVRPPKLTPEERAKLLSERMSGENNPSYGKGLGVVQLSLDGEVVQEYKTIREAERETGTDHSVISRCCKGRVKSAGGFRWRYTEEEECTISI